jgi:glycosyltransferase involved in cell wall biosynthesis
MKIVMLLTNGYSPDIRVYKEAKTLGEIGYDVEILAWDRESGFINAPEIYNGNIFIKRFYPKSKYGSGLKQFKALLSYYMEVIKYLSDQSEYILHCHDFDTLILGLMLKFKKRVKLVYDEHDFFSLYFKKKKKLTYIIIGKIIEIIEKFLLRFVDYHIVVSPKMKELYKKRSKNIEVITNAPFTKDVYYEKKVCSKKLQIAYIGNVNYFDEIKLLLQLSKEFINNVDFHVYGKGVFLSEIKKLYANYTNVFIHGEFSYKLLMSIYKKIDISFMFWKIEYSYIVMPNKFFEAIITETPMIVNKNTEIGEIVKKEKIGFAIDESNAYNMLKKTIQYILAHPECLNKIQNNMHKIKNSYTWKPNEVKLKKIYDSI